ncbi:putative membrane protein, partial [Vibrio parahaemolyticus V-223/04]
GQARLRYWRFWAVLRRRAVW